MPSEEIYISFRTACIMITELVQGRLSIGAALLGSPHVIGVDIDGGALETCHENLQQFDGLSVSQSHFSCQTLGALALHPDFPRQACEQVDMINADILSSTEALTRLQADTVILNPPFGTRRKGADLAFLRAALQVGQLIRSMGHEASLQ